MARARPVLIVLLLFSLSVVATAQAVPMDEWEITVESDISLSADVEKGIKGAAEYIVRELIPQWEEYASIQCFCRVMEREGEIYKVTIAITAEDANGEAVYVKALFEYDAQSGGYVIKEGGSTPIATPIMTPPLPPPKIGVTIWSKFELSEETEKSIKGATERLVEEQINVEEIGGVAVECFVLKSEGEWYTIYVRVFGRPPPSLESKVMAWEAAFKYDLTQGTYEVTSFSEVDNFLVPENIKQRAMTISEKDEEVKAFVAENNLTSQADWINRDEGIVRLQYTTTLVLNETHTLYKGLTAYIDVEGEEVLHVEKYEEIWCAPGLKETPPTPAPTPTMTPAPANAAANTPVEYYGLAAVLVAIAVGTLLVTKKVKT